jgi:hypothetical protein
MLCAAALLAGKYKAEGQMLKWPEAEKGAGSGCIWSGWHDFVVLFFEI